MPTLSSLVAHEVVIATTSIVANEDKVGIMISGVMMSTVLSLFVLLAMGCLNTLRPRQNGRHFADDIFKCIFLNENVWIPSKISLKFVPQGTINNIPGLVQIMAWRRPGDKPLSGPMVVRLPTHICVTRPQWINKQRVLMHRHQGWNVTFSWDIYIYMSCL